MCTDRATELITVDILKKCNRRKISTITQLRTGHGDFGAWYQRFGIQKESYNCKCGELETICHILVECPLRETQRQGLRRVSPEMDMPTLLDSLEQFNWSTRNCRLYLCQGGLRNTKNYKNKNTKKQC